MSLFRRRRFSLKDMDFTAKRGLTWWAAERLHAIVFEYALDHDGEPMQAVDAVNEFRLAERVTRSQAWYLFEIAIEYGHIAWYDDTFQNDLITPGKPKYDYSKYPAPKPELARR